MTLYQQFATINTQVAEQSNSYIYRLRSMLSYTNENNFHKMLKLFLGYRNSISRSRHGMDVEYPDLFAMMVDKFKI